MDKTNVKRIDVPLPGLVAAERREGERSEPSAAPVEGGVVLVREAEGPRPARPDPEVLAKAARRHFNAEYKQRILSEVDLCRDEGAIGALLRREGLYVSGGGGGSHFGGPGGATPRMLDGGEWRLWGVVA